MKTFQDFKILRKLGSGATSDVFLAISSTGEKRALKVFNQFLPQEHGDIAFKRELDNLEKLRNDKIVNVFGLEQNEVGKWVLIQEFIDGVSLREILNEDFNPLERIALALAVACEVLYAIEDSHSKGIIHRDIKPENIMLDSSGRIVLSDFGLSKNLNIQQETFHGSFFGSPQYMSLKQFGNGDVSEDVDIYAIGVLIYEIVGGITPFQGENIEEILIAKRNALFKPLDKVNAYTPLKLVKIVGQILSQEDKETSFKAYQLRFELMNILSDLNIDLGQVVKCFCSHKKYFDKEHEVACVELILKEIEYEFDNTRDEARKGQLLGRILKLDPVNIRAQEEQKRRWPLFLLLTLLGIVSLISYRYSAGQRKVLESNHLKIEQTPVDNVEKIAKKKVDAPSKLKEKKSLVKKVKKKKLPAKALEGFLVVNIPSDIKVFVNGKQVISNGKQVPFAPGKYDITLSKEGHRSMTSEIVIQPGKDTVINLD